MAIGVVLIDAGSFDYPNATFQSTFWIWSVSENPDLDALINLDIRNAVATEVITDISSTEEGEHWHLQKIKGTFRNYWNLSKYPFDRQKLKIFLEEGELGIQAFSYCIDADSRSDFHSPNIKGWTLESLNIIDLWTLVLRAQLLKSLLSLDGRTGLLSGVSPPEPMA